MSKIQKDQVENSATLYRKYRPQSFKEVVGQDHITHTLEASIKNGNIGHAYLFCGSRGTGKTSLARIFAKAIGCTPNDLYELDAASHTQVENIRELNEAVNTLPFESSYKVYILDEVHMLSKNAWNALLKTLEEPPQHAVFILATTELEKVPETVVSRCQSFIFRKPTQAILKEMVLKLAKSEDFKLEPASADLIAFLGDRSFRDTQSILQKVIGASSDKKISVEEVLEITGAPRSESVNGFISAIDSQNIEDGLQAISKIAEENIDPEIYIKMILEKVRNILLLRLSPSTAEKIRDKYSDQDFTFIDNLAKKKEVKINSNVLAGLLCTSDEIRKSSVPEVTLELCLYSLLGE